MPRVGFVDMFEQKSASATSVGSETVEMLSASRKKLQSWIEARNYAGYEPYDLLNSPYLSGPLPRKRPFNILLTQTGRRFAGERTRQWLQIPPSKNPKALGLLLSAYCDLWKSGESVREKAMNLKSELVRLRSPDPDYFCWGYDWDFYSLRGPVMPAFSPNAIATYFCAQGLLDIAETFGDSDARDMADSASEFFLRRLNRSVDQEDRLCFSYTPSNNSVIYNSSALVAAFLARSASSIGHCNYKEARRAMNFLVTAQLPNGAWFYGQQSRQRWVDHFHTGYNLCALLDYIQYSGDRSLEPSLTLGYEFYKQNFFNSDGAPKYFDNSVYPIDIHSCSQAILTFLAFAARDEAALDFAIRSAEWAVRNMQAAEGCFYFQRHRFWTNHTPYMRWGQAWMLRALSRLHQFCRAGA